MLRDEYGNPICDCGEYLEAQVPEPGVVEFYYPFCDVYRFLDRYHYTMYIIHKLAPNYFYRSRLG